MKKIYVCYHDRYGCAALPQGMKREYASVDDFLTAKDKASRIEENKWNSPDEYSLAEISLADDEEYHIEDYDGKESISLRKKGKITSTIKTIDL